MIGMETAGHFLAQIQDKMIHDAKTLMVVQKLLVDLKQLKNEKIDELFEKHEVKIDDPN